MLTPNSLSVFTRKLWSVLKHPTGIKRDRFNINIQLFKYSQKRTLSYGTTLATYFATNHRQSTLVLAKEALRQGQRAFVGKVSSNCCSPDYYM